MSWAKVFGITHVGDAVDGNSLEVVLIELLDSRLEVGSGLVLDETLATGAGSVALTVDLTVDNVKAGLAREILQILEVVLGGAFNKKRTSAQAAKVYLIASLTGASKYLPASWSRTEDP